jgi:hypothetical protein
VLSPNRLSEWWWGSMAHSLKQGHTRAGQRHQFEILTGRVEASQRGGEAFAVVRDLDPYAKRRVQAILRSSFIRQPNIA